MRIIHTSDWHLGHELHGYSRAYEHDRFLDWLLGRLVDLKADALLVTGDVHDVTNPPAHAVRQLYRFLSRALEACPGLQIIILGGNHDSAARIELPAALLPERRVRLVGGLPRRDGEVCIDDLLIPLNNAAGEWAVTCVALPYLRPGDLPAGAAGLGRRFREAIDAGVAHADGRAVIVTGHLHISGCAVSELSERRIVVGGEEAVASSLFDDRIAYAALGHLHRPQQVEGPCLIRYAGSPIPLSATERDYVHSIAVVDVVGSKASSALVTIPRAVDFLSVAGGVEEVLDALEALDATDLGPARPFIEVSVNLERPEPELRQRIETALREKPYRLTRIVQQRSGAGGSLADGIATVELGELAPVAVFDRLYEAHHSSAPPDELRKAFETLFTEASAGGELGEEAVQ